MNRAFSGKGFKVLVTVVCLLLVLALVTAGNSTVGGLFSGFILTPLQRVAAEATGSAGQVVTLPKDPQELEEENSRLREENRRLTDELVEYYDIKRENEELYKFYDIKKSNEDFSVVPASVIARDPNEIFYGFVLDAGTADGVSPGDPVVTDNGLVGFVSEVSIKTAKVTCLLSPEVRVGAVDKKTGDEGVISGSPLYADSGSTVLENLKERHSIKVGDIIVTSGYGGAYPRNLKIGTVSKLLSDSYTGTPIAVIRPFEDARFVSSAAIITNFTGKGVIESSSPELPQTSGRSAG